MKWSKLLHGVAAISGFGGILALFGAWIATSRGSFLGQTEQHLFNDAQALLLASIAFGIGTLLHQRNEDTKKNKNRRG